MLDIVNSFLDKISLRMRADLGKSTRDIGYLSRAFGRQGILFQQVVN